MSDIPVPHVASPEVRELTLVERAVADATSRLGEIDREVDILRQKRKDANARIADLTAERIEVVKLANVGKPRIQKPKA